MVATEPHRKGNKRVTSTVKVNHHLISEYKNKEMKVKAFQEEF